MCACNSGFLFAFLSRLFKFYLYVFFSSYSKSQEMFLLVVLAILDLACQFSILIKYHNFTFSFVFLVINYKILPNCSCEMVNATADCFQKASACFSGFEDWCHQKILVFEDRQKSFLLEEKYFVNRIVSWSENL